MYLDKKEYEFLGFEKSRSKEKMYDAILEHKRTKKIKRMPFGSSSYENYRDITGLNLYPHLIHNDKKRRASFKARMKHNLRDGYWSSSYFALRFLW